MLHEFTALVTETIEKGFTARLVPFGVKVPYGKGTVEFAAGSIHVPSSPVPLTMDHSGGVLDRLGVMERSFETGDGMYAEFLFADTANAADVRELLKVGAVTDVSVGVELAADFDGGIMEGMLDHVTVTPHGRFGKADKPSKVLAVHDDKEANVPEIEEAAAPVVAEYDDKPLLEQLAVMADKLDTFETKVVDEPPLFASMGDFVRSSMLASEDEESARKMAKFALDTDDTTGAAGVVPDYLSSEYLSIIATSRAFIGNIQSDSIGSSGMSVVYPKKTSGPSVAVQATENLEVDSTALVIGSLSVDLITYAGANKVSQQLIRRSSPSFVDILFRELAGQYAEVTDAASIAAAVAGAGGTAVLADLSTSAAATFAAFQVGNAAIISATRQPADTIWLDPTRWAELNSLVDSDGRPLLVYGPNGPTNAQGLSSGPAVTAQYHGWLVRLDVDAAAGTCLMANSSTVANLESSPVQLSTVQTSTLSTDLGIYGMQNIVVKFAGGLYTLTLV